MDSNTYTHIVNDLISRNSLRNLLPLRFTTPLNAVDNTACETVSYFLRSLVSENKSDALHDLYRPPLLATEMDNYASFLFRQAHRAIADLHDTPDDTHLFAHTGTETLSFLCSSISPKWAPAFPKADSVSMAMCSCLLEACMHAGWCPNGFESKAKRAAHLYCIECRKSLYNASEHHIVTIIGYLQSAWLFAQKTEGINEETLPWEHTDYSHHFFWNLRKHETDERVGYHLYRFIRRSLYLVIPQYVNNVPHPFSRLSLEGKLGVSISIDGAPFSTIELRESLPIERPKHRGMRFIYTGISSTGKTIAWHIIIQIFENTVYRNDIIQTLEHSATITRMEYRLENDMVLQRISPALFRDTQSNSAVIEFLDSPCEFNYEGQEKEGISLFRGGAVHLQPLKPVEMASAWLHGTTGLSINKTNLTGMYSRSP